jgi:hypothetical protein
VSDWKLLSENKPNMGQWYLFARYFVDSWEYMAGVITEIRQVGNEFYYTAESESSDSVYYTCEPDKCLFKEIKEPKK